MRRLLRGAFNLRPPVAKYTAIWDVKIVLDFLSAMIDNNHKDLTLKLATLLMILSGNRVNMLTYMHITCMYINKEECAFTFDHVFSRPRSQDPMVNFQSVLW